MRAAWLVVMCACGRYGLDTTIPEANDAVACVAETDAAFCARLGKSCEAVTAHDNCAVPRTVDCGTCSAPASACVANTCSVPLCADAAGAYSFPATGSIVASLHVSKTQEALLGISADAKSILFLRGVGAPNACVTIGSILYIGDDPTGTFNYTLNDLSSVVALSTFTKSEETMTLTTEGRTIIGVATTGELQASTRSATGLTDFSAPNKTQFAAINAALPAGGSVTWPYLTRDGLSFSFAITGATVTQENGVYQSVRASTSDPLPAATQLAGDAQTYNGLSGISDDGMTAFGATTTYATVVLSRTSTSQPFTNASGATAPGLAWRVIPTSSCAFVVGTCEPGGCQNEDICTWAKQ